MPATFKNDGSTDLLLTIKGIDTTVKAGDKDRERGSKRLEPRNLLDVMGQDKST